MIDERLKHIQLLRDAFNEYLVHAYEGPIEPSEKMLSYDFDFIDGRKWHALGKAMVRCDLRELTNLINQWGELLCRWHAWNKVLSGRDDDMEVWELQSEFLDSTVRECLITPASIRDTITSVATAAFHQVRLSIDCSYKDHLEGDQTKCGEQPKTISRRQKEKRLFHLLQIWPQARDFIDNLQKINDQHYVNVTRDYRNLTSHTIGPRLGIGDTRTVTRRIEQARALKKMPDGSHVFEDVKDKLRVTYGFGGTPPLNLEEARVANLEQYKKACSCYMEYRSLLENTVAEIELADSGSHKAEK